MASFTFSPINTTDLSTGTFYIHLLNNTPSGSETTVSELTLSDGINYQPTLLTGLIYNSIKWSFNNVTFPTITFTTPPTGYVICKRVGVSISNTDPVLFYNDIVNIINQNFTLPTGKYTLTVKFPNDGLLKFNNYYEYSVGDYVNNETIPKGLMYLLGSRNNTRTFVTPFDNSYVRNYSTGILDYTDRFINNIVAETPRFCFNFGSRKIQIGTFGFYNRDTNALVWNIYGSNYLPNGIDDTELITTLNTNWTLLGTSNSVVAGWNFINVNNPTFWQYIKLEKNGSSTGVIQEIEFYNSKIRTTHPNCYSTVLDLPFNTDILDKSGFENNVTLVGASGLVSNSLFSDNGGYANITTTTYDSGANSILNLGARDYEIQLETRQQVTSIDNAVRGILTWDGSEFPLIFGYFNNAYTHAVGTTSSWFFDTYANNFRPSATITDFDTLTGSRYVNTFNFKVNNTANYTLVSSGTVGNAGTLTIARNGTTANKMYIRNLKVIT